MGEKVCISLERIHLEEDAGRSLHRGAYSLINFNRGGSPSFGNCYEALS